MKDRRNMPASEHTLIVIALKDELPAYLVPDWQVAVCGVGKVNAAVNMQRLITEHRPRQVINLGTAGAVTDSLEGLVEVGRVCQRDMDVTGLGVEAGITPFDDLGGEIILSDSSVICGTGDNFLQGLPEIPCDIVDMELYALAKVCQMNEIPIISYKYISDKADDSASHDWKQALKTAAQSFAGFLNSIRG